MEKSELAPGFLLAAPSLRDPNFEKSVVLLGRHDDEGALGWVINGDELTSVAALLGASGIVPPEADLPNAAAFGRAACIGGPVAPQTGWLVYRRSEEPLDGEITLGTDVGVTGEASAFNALIRGAGPADFRLVLGCAGWAPGQLEAEISEGAWLPVDLEADLVFETEPEELWDQAYRRTIGTSPAAFSSRPAKA